MNKRPYPERGSTGLHVHPRISLAWESPASASQEPELQTYATTPAPFVCLGTFGLLWVHAYGSQRACGTVSPVPPCRFQRWSLGLDSSHLLYLLSCLTDPILLLELHSWLTFDMACPSGDQCAGLPRSLRIDQWETKEFSLKSSHVFLFVVLLRWGLKQPRLTLNSVCS